MANCGPAEGQYKTRPRQPRLPYRGVEGFQAVDFHSRAPPPAHCVTELASSAAPPTRAAPRKQEEEDRPMIEGARAFHPGHVCRETSSGAEASTPSQPNPPRAVSSASHCTMLNARPPPGLRPAANLYRRWPGPGHPAAGRGPPRRLADNGPPGARGRRRWPPANSRTAASVRPARGALAGGSDVRFSSARYPRRRLSRRSGSGRNRTSHRVTGQAGAADRLQPVRPHHGINHERDVGRKREFLGQPGRVRLHAGRPRPPRPTQPPSSAVPW